MGEHRSDRLRVLERPEVPLQNDLSEGRVRDYVKGRKISGSARGATGRATPDVLAGPKATCRGLGVNSWSYLQDRVRGRGEIPRSAALIRAKAEAMGARKGEAAPEAGGAVG